MSIYCGYADIMNPDPLRCPLYRHILSYNPDTYLEIHTSGKSIYMMCGPVSVCRLESPLAEDPHEES